MSAVREDRKQDESPERRRTPNAAIGERGVCLRCREYFGTKSTCRNCGVGRHQQIASRNKMRRRKIGGKRGRNSGKVSQHGKK